MNGTYCLRVRSHAHSLCTTHPTAASLACAAYGNISVPLPNTGTYPDQVHWAIWMLCLCPPFVIAAFMLLRDGLASFFPW